MTAPRRHYKRLALGKLLMLYAVTIIATAVGKQCASCHAADEVSAYSLVDTHVHFWDLKRPEGIYWISPDDKVLYRSFLPSTFEAIAKANQVKAVIVVQAGQSLPDNQWNLDITAHNKQLYRGVVGNLSTVIGTDEFRSRFDKLCEDKRFLGYRLSGRYEKNLTKAFFRDMKHTADQGKSVDFLLGEYTLDDVAEIARSTPKLRIMLDHFGNVQLGRQPLDAEWVKKLRAVAERDNVYCKVSALYGRVKERPAPSDIRFYQPILDVVFEAFGEDRLVYGSDWPVTESSGDYAAVVKLTRAYFTSKGERVAEKLFARNAATFYRIEKP